MLLPSRRKCIENTMVRLDMSAGISTFDIKHGVTRDGVITFLDKIQNDSSFSDIRKSEGSRERIKELQIEKQ
jgi:hypothetical protein